VSDIERVQSTYLTLTKTLGGRLGGVLVCLPLDPRVAGSNPTKAMDF
jgi:hypothetical protein